MTTTTGQTRDTIAVDTLAYFRYRSVNVRSCATMTRTATTPTPRTRGSKWVAIRRRILQRDGFRCVVCKGNGKLTLADEVDHIVPLERGGTDDGLNLRALCKPCHLVETAKQFGYEHRPKVLPGVDGWPI